MSTSSITTVRQAAWDHELAFTPQMLGGSSNGSGRTPSPEEVWVAGMEQGRMKNQRFLRLILKVREDLRPGSINVKQKLVLAKSAQGEKLLDQIYTRREELIGKKLSEFEYVKLIPETRVAVPHQR